MVECRLEKVVAGKRISNVKQNERSEEEKRGNEAAALPSLLFIGGGKNVKR